ncbi:MAG: nitronate monooxygenase [Verrucomicrobiales bacterium]|nr:nitronate monooxygenase [Verrucomicrobiales bacterium]
MGIGVSSYQLARSVARTGQLGVVSGTSLDTVFARRLQLGDPGGDLRRAVAHFPYPEIAARVWDRWFIEGGKTAEQPFRLIPLQSLTPPQHLTELTVLANFAEVFLAKEGHDGVVGINFLEKIQMPTLPSIFGAMLAGVDFVLMGAGIPRAIPGILDDLAAGRAVKLRLDVEGALSGEEFAMTFDPGAFCGAAAPDLKRPRFLAVIASSTLAITLARKSSGRVDGFVVEGPTAGGHNAPPRGTMQLSDSGEPIYGERDMPELEKIRALGLPFWLAGSFGAPGRLAEALRLGAAGIQAGTAFAFCEESGIVPEIKRQVIAASRAGEVRLFTDPAASPTGFPFKVVQVEGTLSDPAIYAARERVCDLGYLRQAYRRDDGTLGFRCPGEPVDIYLRKGGTAEDAAGRKCLCNGLSATIGLGQSLGGGHVEKALVTAGSEVAHIARFLAPGHETYRAEEVIHALLA